jgi:hypothetical protein
MRRGFGIVLLALGTIIGFGWGIARVTGYCPGGCAHGAYGHGFYGRGPWGEGRERFEDRAADACVRAAERVLAERHTAPPNAPPAAPAPAPEHAPAP